MIVANQRSRQLRSLLSFFIILCLACPAFAQETAPFAAFDAASEPDLKDPHDLAIGPDGRLYVADKLANQITLLDKDNNILAQLGDDDSWRNRVLDKKEKMRASPGKWQVGKFIHPHDAAFDKDGNLFIVEWVVGGRVTKLRKVS